MEHKLTTISVREREFDVSVDKAGRFSALFNNDWLTAPTLAELREKLIRATKNTKISIPFVEWDGKKIRHGVCTGRHATNRNLLVKYADAKSGEQASSWALDNVVDPQFEAGYVQVCEQYEAAKLAKEKFEDQHGLELKKLVDKALADDGGAA